VHPAASIIVFTTLSGAGYGLLFWLGLGSATGVLSAERGFGTASLGLAFVAVSAGLCASVFHLGRPERALRAFSQWRSSWLSREGIASVVTYAPWLLFAWGWIIRGDTHGLIAVFAFLAACGAAATVVCTAYIYRSLKPIAHWHNAWVPANFLALAGLTGALWLAALSSLFGAETPLALRLSLLLVALAAALKLGYWRHIDHHPGAATVESATGLGALGHVRLFESPNTSENYLMKEMGFRLARKHARQLRRIALQLAFVLPVLLILFAMTQIGWTHRMAVLVAALSATLGVLVERWLFFAEAKHTVTLYYGAARA
jgi:sulfite dehydrogenase (quinone) subunit SoeC